MSNWDFVQRLKRYGTTSQAKKSRIRPLSQAFTSTASSQATQTSAAKYETPIPGPSRRSSRSFNAGNDWSQMRKAIEEEVVLKKEPDSYTTSPEQSVEPSPSVNGFHYSTPDTDIEMTHSEEVSQLVQPGIPSVPSTVALPTSTLTPQWNLPRNPKEDFEIVSFSKAHQDRFDNLGLSWGVQWEAPRRWIVHASKQIARIAKLLEAGWDAIPLDKLSELCGSSAEQAPRVLSVLLSGHPLYPLLNALEKTTRPSSYTWPWDEYDKEEESIRDGSTARLGGDGGYFGGKIDQIVRLTVEKEQFKFTLQPPAKSNSYRFRRFAGSRRMLEVRFSEKDKDIKPFKVIDFFTHKALVINGRIFRAFYASKKSIHLIETNDLSKYPDADTHISALRNDLADPLFGDDHRMSLVDFIQWHNPLYASPNQPVPKWVSRFALGFSDSQPGIPFAPSNIFFIDDIVATGGSGNSAIMTDGAGFINASALHKLAAIMKWSYMPVCVQARFGGSKGLFILHPSDRKREDEPRIYIRTSQVKVKHHPDPSYWCPSQRILDVLARGPLSTGIQITDQIIMNLAHNGVGTSTLDALTQDHIKTADFIPLMHDDHLMRLWDTIYSQGNVQDLRARGLTPAALARAQGMVDISGEDDRHWSSNVKFTYQDDPHSGMPPNYETQALGLLGSGFRPDFYPLFTRLESLHKQLLFGLDEKVHIRITDSATAFVIPDPLGVLEEGQVFCGFRSPVRDSSGEEKFCISGPVLVTRSPCILPSDVRKVMSVDNRELWNAGYHDVIVFSVKGNSSQASILGGGDYDGDTVTMIWDQNLVNQFTNSDTWYPNVDVSNCFDLRRGLAKDVAPNDHETVLNALLGPLTPGQVGMYGNWQAQAAKLHGLDHPDAVRLGNVFTTCLDGQKTGLVPRDAVIKRDSKDWNNVDARLPRKLTVIEDLKYVLDLHRRDREAKMGELKPYRRQDKDLIAPYIEELKLSKDDPVWTAELTEIKNFVDHMRHEFNDGEFSVHKRHGPPRFDRKEGGKVVSGKTHSPGQKQEASHAAAEAYYLGLPRSFTRVLDERGQPKQFVRIRGSAVQKIAASYAYKSDNWSEPRFSFAVAWKELCNIKAEAQGMSVTMTTHIANAMAVPRKLRAQMDLLNDNEN